MTVAAPDQDVLLATKLHVPRPQPGFVPRQRLVRVLDEGLARGWFWSAPRPGLERRRGRRPVAWLSLDEGDNDPARFWRHAVAALDRMRPGIAERAGRCSARRHRRRSRGW